jgi:type I restriction enzyme S subunit
MTDELPQFWAAARLPEICDVIMGQSPPSSTYHDEPRGLPFFQGKADFGLLYPTARKWCDAPSKIARPDDVLLSIRAPVGPTNMAKEMSCIGRGLAALRPADGVDGRYVLYALRRLEDELAGLATGTTFPAVSGRVLSNFEVPVPPSREQRRIVSRIDALQAHSRKARESLAEIGPLLSQFRQSLLSAAFRGDLTADWRAANPNTEPATELLARIRQQRRRQWEEAELAKCEAKGKLPRHGWRTRNEEPVPVVDPHLPALPNGWSWSVIDELCTKIVDCPHSTPKWSASGKLCVRTTEFRPGHLDLTKAQYVTHATFEDRIKRLRPEPGDVLYSREGGILGIACQIPEGMELCLGQRMMLMRPDSTIDASLIMHWLNSPYIFLDRVQAKIQGAASPHINVAEVRRFPFPVAPRQEQGELSRRIRKGLDLAESIHKLQTSCHHDLNHLDQSILAKAFRGDLVPQDPRDEPASVLLERIRKTRTEGPASRTKRGATGKRKTARHSSVPEEQSLLALLRQADQPMLVEHLHTASGLSSKEFFSQLRDAIANGTIRKVVTHSDESYVEPAG